MPNPSIAAWTANSLLLVIDGSFDCHLKPLAVLQEFPFVRDLVARPSATRRIGGTEVTRMGGTPCRER